MLYYHYITICKEECMSEKKCSVKGCMRPIAIVKHALCRAHLQKYYRNGDPGQDQIRIKRKYKPYDPKKKVTSKDGD
jgi:hypothetical protein